VEKNSLADVEFLGREFPAVHIICTHRCADEEMWAAAMNAGAADLCFAHDVEAIVQAAIAGVYKKRAAAA
jgi:hypothetical protein